MTDEDDARWERYVAVPALVLSLPLYVAFSATYVLTREAFASALTFIDSCEHAFSRDEPVRDAA